MGGCFGLWVSGLIFGGLRFRFFCLGFALGGG